MKKDLFDISITLGQESTTYPGDPAYKRETVCSLETGGVAQVSKLTLCAHSGTHIDLPAHFIAGSRTIEQYPVEDFLMPAQVVGIENRTCVTRAELEKKNLARDHALLFKTANSSSGLVTSGHFQPEWVYLGLDAAEFCVEQKIPLVGLDYLSLDRYGDKDYPVHHKVLSTGMIVLENINLKSVPEGRYFLFCFPLKTGGAEGAPVRAVLAREGVFHREIPGR
ncbi:MAG: cyclase family protein [Gemmatimonadota bacterium]|nr:cyclase family protein [Gemmatimonadota bacterium]